MSKTDLDEYPGEPLTELENKKLRRLLEQDDRAHWFWSTSRIWVTSVAATIGGAIIIANGGLDLLKRLLGVK